MLPLNVTSSLNLTVLLNTTGPSNWDKICLEVPPSTIILSLQITSSNITLNREGFSPVTVGIGASNVLSSVVHTSVNNSTSRSFL